LSSAAGWLPPGAEDIKSAPVPAQPKKTDLDTETTQPNTPEEVLKPSGQGSSQSTKKATPPRQPPRS
jgi:hypothetical protein